MRDHGATHFRKTRSYQSPLVLNLNTTRVMMAAPNGMPRKAATLVAIVDTRCPRPPIPSRSRPMRRVSSVTSSVQDVTHHCDTSGKAD
ncbi:hypothetical protein KCU89_g18, partial [Aureobasidium melanogenum]